VRGRAAVLLQPKWACSGLHAGANEATVLVQSRRAYPRPRRPSLVAVDPDTRSYEGIESTYDAAGGVDITWLTSPSDQLCQPVL
jgi:hypothetical protein